MKMKKEDKLKQNAFLSLYEPVHDRFARYCKAVAGNDERSRDLINETLLRAFEGFDNIKKKESFLYFLFSTAKRVWSNKVRTKKHWQDYDEAVIDNRINSQYENPEMKVDTHFLYKAMDQLPDEQKEALILFEIMGFSLNEIQEIQESGLSAVKARVTRGRKKLAGLLSDLESKIDS